MHMANELGIGQNQYSLNSMIPDIRLSDRVLRKGNW